MYYEHQANTYLNEILSSDISTQEEAKPMTPVKQIRHRKITSVSKSEKNS